MGRTKGRPRGTGGARGRHAQHLSAQSHMVRSRTRASGSRWWRALVTMVVVVSRGMPWVRDTAALVSAQTEDHHDAAAAGNEQARKAPVRVEPSSMANARAAAQRLIRAVTTTEAARFQKDLATVLGAAPLDALDIASLMREARETAAQAPTIAKDIGSTRENASTTATATTGATTTEEPHFECLAAAAAGAVPQQPLPETESTQSTKEEHRNRDARMSADRHARGLLATVHDPACTSREFDVRDESSSFDAEEAIRVLEKCRILVLRNVLSEETIQRVLPRYEAYIDSVASGERSSEGTTTFGGDYFILKEDDDRFNYMATQELVEASSGLWDHELLLGVLSDPRILGASVILNHAGTIDAAPGAGAQYWHADGHYVHSPDDATGFAGVAGHDLAPFAINLFTPLRPSTGIRRAHGPTEFCLGTSHLKGHDAETDLPVTDSSLLNDGIVEDLQEFEWYTRQGMPFDCPEDLIRIPLLNLGDVLLFDYMLTHRGGANTSGKNTNGLPATHRSVVFGTYSRPWFRDTNFDTEFSTTRYQPPTVLEELTRLTRFALVDDEEGGEDDEEHYDDDEEEEEGDD